MFAIEDILEFRRENKQMADQIAADTKRSTIRKANEAAAQALLEAERSYWNAFYAKATTQEERWTAIDELDRLDTLERVS